MEVQILADLPDTWLRASWQYTTVGLAPARLRAAARDRRWNTRYAVASEGDKPLGILPIYRAVTDQRPYSEYDAPAVSEELFSGAPDDPREWLLIGGRRDLVAGAPVRSDLSPVEAERVRWELGRRAFDEARSNGLLGMMLYVRVSEVSVFLSAAGPTGDTAVIGGDATLRIDRHQPRPYPAGLSRKRRYTVLREWRERDSLGLRSEVVPAEEVFDEAAPLVVEVKNKYGIPDHPRLVAMRLREWVASGIGKYLAFVVRDPGGQLTASAFVCHDGPVLEVYELGLRQDAENRHLAYLEATIYGPLRYGTTHECRAIQLGLGSPTPKWIRGATVEPVFAISADARPGAESIPRRGADRATS